MKRVLMIAYLFPPVGGIGSAGSQRVLKFAKYLPVYHWAPVILTVREQYYESYFSVDYSLLERVPAGMTIVRTGVFRWLTKVLRWKRKIIDTFYSHSSDMITQTHTATERVKDVGHDAPTNIGWYQRFKDSITDLFEIPDEEMGWFLPGLFAGLSAIRRERINVVYSTGRPWTSHLIGTALKLMTGKPLVVDFRDPWITNPFRLKYSALRERLETYFEKIVIEHADLVIANTSELREEFVKRFPAQPSEKFIAILNGFDPDDYPTDFSGNDTAARPQFTIAHTGFLYGRRDPQRFLEAIKLVIEKGDVDRDKLQVWLVGNADLPYDLQGYIRTNGLYGLVSVKDHVPYKESLEYLQQSDLLLLLQPGTKTQVPSKLFEYVGMKKSILTISPQDGATGVLVARECLGTVADPDNVLQIADAIVQEYQRWIQRHTFKSNYETAYEKFNVKNMTASLAGELSRLAH